MPKIFIIFILITLNACVSSNVVKTGKTAFDLNQFELASTLLEEEFSKSRTQSDKSEIAFLLGRTYKYLLKPESSQTWFQQADNLGYGFKAKIAVAYGYKSIDNYPKALIAFTELSKLPTLKEEATKEIRVINNLLAEKPPKDYFYKTLKISPSSQYSTYSPYLIADNQLVVTSDGENAIGDGIYSWTNRKYSDLFIMNKNGGLTKNFSSSINSEANEGAATFNKNFSEIFFTRCSSEKSGGDDFCKIFYSKYINDIWSLPIEMPFTKSGINYGQPTLVENDSVMIFAALSEDNLNGYDLWYTDRFDGVWSEPLPMPSNINTQGNEYFPTSDKDTLYFSSDYHPGRGGLDIFKTYLRDGKWVNPQGLESPINSSKDDYSLIHDYEISSRKNLIRKGYFASNRGGNGVDELYMFEQISRTDIEIALPKDTLIAEIIKPKIDTFKTVVTAPEIYDYDIYLALKVIDAESRFSSARPIPVKNALVRVVNSQEGSKLSGRVDRNGLFIKQLEGGKAYEYTISADSYLTKKILVPTTRLKRPEPGGTITINLEVDLERIVKNREYLLADIYYDLDKYDIRKDAQPRLDSLALMLSINPTINIELGSHTDCRGEDDYNLLLSQKRAQAAVDYLVKKGIDKARLMAKGYGETVFKNNCRCESCTEEEHQQNRRTSFIIF
jgi:outer membrane protein OmpA-like peptidoglycan-associated protein